MLLRWAKPQDSPELAQVFYAAVRKGASPYSQEQRIAWLSTPPSGKPWTDRLARMDVLIAENDRQIMGFMSIEAGGHIDLAFIRPEHQGSGLFRRLYADIELKARKGGEPRLWTHASLMAQPAFKAMGFVVIHHETVARHGQNLRRAKMEKPLT
ncbi:MAG: GNAT family N-acetyltransferase [Paracoccaceae bacterium]|nr:GNAT family N-acetyltransferase [Paracoccaceae bacterium]